MHALMSVATEWPAHTVSADETKAFLATYVQRVDAEHWRHEVDAAGVSSRRTVGSLQEMLRTGGIEARNARYAEEALPLGTRAAQAALAQAEVSAAEIDSLIVSSSTGHMIPSLADRLALRLGLRPHVERLPLNGLGCVGSMRALAAAARGPSRTRTLVVSVEVCSPWLQPEEPSPEDVVTAMTFGDGAAAAVVGGGDVEGRPEMIAHQSVLWPSSLDARGAVLTSTGFRHVATPALPLSVMRNLRNSVDSFLQRNSVARKDIDFVLVNPRNPRLLAAVASVLSVPESHLAAARQVWDTRGNTLSVGPLYLLQTLQCAAPPRAGAVGLVVVLGPGVSCDLMLLRWQGKVACAPLQG